KTVPALAYPPEQHHHRTPEGDEETVDAITREDLIEYHRRLYRANGLILTVVGEVTAPRILEQLAALWNGRRAGGPIAAIVAPKAGPASAGQRPAVEIRGKG